MSYSNRVKSHQIEPVYDSQNNRSEFRFPANKIFSTNVVLGNVGVRIQAGMTVSRYNALGGVASLIDTAYLYDGNVELASCQHATEWSAWKQTRKTNSALKDKTSMLLGNSAGYRYEKADERVTAAGNKSIGKVLSRDRVEDGNAIRTDGVGGTVALNELLPVLEALPYLDTSIFKNLRVVVEYNLYDSVRKRNVLRAQKDNTIFTQRPLLFVEEFVDQKSVESIIGKMDSVVFDNVESDRMVVPSKNVLTSNSDGSGVQPLSFHLSGFNSKKLGKIVLVKQPQLAGTYEAGNTDFNAGQLDSIALFKESTQVRVNGQNVFSKSGIDKPNKRLARLVDTWGSGSLMPFANGLAYKAPDDQPRSNYIEQGNSAIGYCDYFGVDVGYTKVEDLQIDFSRQAVFCDTGDAANDATDTANSRYNQSVSLIAFGMTRKAIEVSKDGYNIVYV